MSGDVFVGDLEQNIIRRFTSTGDEVWRVGGTGTGMAQFNGVWGLSTDASGNIYVADTNNARIQVLTADGKFVREWDGYEGVRFDEPTGVYVHSDDTVYVCDARDESILLFDLEGRPLERWSLPDIAGFVTEPEDIVVDSTGLNIYVAEVRQARVLHLQRESMMR